MNFDDRLLLTRYADGELNEEQRAFVEARLVRDAELRAELADLVLLKASLDIGLAGAKIPPSQGPASQDLPAQNPFPLTPATTVRFPSTPTWAEQSRKVVAASVIAVFAAGLGFWAIFGTGSRPDSSPQNVQASVTPAGDRSPQKSVEGLTGPINRDLLLARVAEIQDPATTVARRQALYRSFNEFDRPTIEPLIWSLETWEEEAKAKATLLANLPDKVGDYDALVRAAKGAWSAKAIEPLGVLITHLRFYPTPETEAFFVEILDAQPQGGSWIAASLATMQRAFPESAAIGDRVVRAMTDLDELTRARAGMARAAIGKREGIECALKLLDSKSPDVRALATATIARHGTKLDIPRLAGALDDNEAAIRIAARDAFEKHGIPIPPSTVPSRNL